MPWKTLDEMELDGKTVLVRVDINVPVEDGKVTDPTRIEKIVPTVTDILEAGGKPVLVAHFGRPKGKVVPEMSLKVTVPALEAALGREVVFVGDSGKTNKQAVAEMKPGQVLLLENMRFDPGEEANDGRLAAELAALADVYCNDAFSAAHRAHASTEAVAQLLPNCAGRLMEAELKALEAALSDPKRPVAAVVGGAKVSTKLDLLSNLLRKVDYLVIGGGMANTFLAAKGIDVGTSLAEHDLADTAREVMSAAEEVSCEIVLPVDIVVARAFEAGAESETVAAEACPSDAMILDAGPDSVARIGDIFGKCETLIWNGPLGAFEIPPFDTATNAAAQKAAELTEAGELISVAGGGDTVSALNRAGVADKFSYISTAGGAFLEWMEGKTLPGVAALRTGSQD
ncbi:phosphoglycerate kinase [Tranquillimonas rosea]|uniref:Phosphoglycerate kinase n=1 Tax=Tranquillimonas rosea TaxID=641238 RepID=A0A1H9TCJ0_9RHOB|nr:phosphoglycerate kinase [Tranquillimonas rosea]SER94828.1 phosphoglycerate kinase [Tranquillimonas rosea]